jgi:hypothetical protein
MFVNEEESVAKRQWKSYQQQQQKLVASTEEREPNAASPPPPPQQQQPLNQRELVHPFDVGCLDEDVRNVSEKISSSLSYSTVPSTTGSEINNSASLLNRPQRQRKSISMVLLPKIALLRKAMDRDRLSRLVQKRPSPKELNRSPKTATVLHAYHLIAYSTISPDLVPLTMQLSFLLKGERLSHWLYRRPSLSVILNERHILKTEVRTAWMVCPGVVKKVRFYEGLIQERRDYEQRQQALLIQQQIQQHQYQQHHQHLSQTAVA